MLKNTRGSLPIRAINGAAVRLPRGPLGWIAVVVMFTLVSQATLASPRRPVFLHFFDWFDHPSWLEDTFVDPPDWNAIGTSLDKKATRPFYAAQFRYIKQLGVDAIAWEYHAQIGAPKTLPSAAALDALRDAGLTIAPVYDLEISLQVYQKRAELRPEQATPGLIAANQDTTDLICADLVEFYRQVPADRIGMDENGNTAAFVFGFGFNDADVGVAAWDAFAQRLDSCLTPVMGKRWKLYWAATNHPFEEHLFLKHRDHFTPWQFVSDMPQSQFSHDSVTWNFGFDNLGVQHRYHLPRVVRVDPRYIEEAAWLASAADPALVFLYGWNEPFEGTFLFPSRERGSLKADTAKEYIQSMRRGQVSPLPKTLIVVDDLDDLWGRRRGDWHLTLLREMLLYRMRLFAPRADVVTMAEVTGDLLSRYEGVIDLTSDKTPELVSAIEAQIPRLRLLALDPVAHPGPGSYADMFFDAVATRPLNREITVLPAMTKVFARDDVHAGTVCRTCGVLLWAKADDERLPLIVTRDGNVLLNSYANDDAVVTAAFQAFYGRPMGCSILYGEAYASQRLEISPDGHVTENHLQRGSVDLGLTLPNRPAWLVLPPEVPETEFGFLFGLDAMPIDAIESPLVFR